MQHTIVKVFRSIPEQNSFTVLCRQMSHTIKNVPKDPFRYQRYGTAGCPLATTLFPGATSHWAIWPCKHLQQKLKDIAILHSSRDFVLAQSSYIHNLQQMCNSHKEITQIVIPIN